MARRGSRSLLIGADRFVCADGRSLNLNRPGVVRALLDEASARGWQAEASELNGWDLFDAVAGSEPPQRG